MFEFTAPELIQALVALVSALGLGKLISDWATRRVKQRDDALADERMTRDKMFEASVNAAKLEAENTFLKQQLSDCLARKP